MYDFLNPYLYSKLNSGLISAVEEPTLNTIIVPFNDVVHYRHRPRHFNDTCALTLMSRLPASPETQSTLTN